MRRALRKLTPERLRQLVYDSGRRRRRAWRRAPGLERLTNDAVALTFDDGPDPAFTPALLEALDRAGASATFFVVGEQIVGNEALLRDVAAAGHEVALHGMTHRRHNGLTEAEAREDLERGLATIESAGVPRPTRYRPPYGATSPTLAAICADLGLELAYWSAWGQDWEPLPAARIAALVERDLDPGAIVLLHDSPRYAEREDATPTVEAVATIAERARAGGLRLVSLAS